MTFGLDTNQNCQDLAPAIRAAGYTFVCRYYNVRNMTKNLTLKEAKTLSEEGIYVVGIWENGLPTRGSYFSYKRGVDDGIGAYDYANKVIGQPGGTPVYFAVDYDASPADVRGPISNYFQGVADAFERKRITGKKHYSIGVYGSGMTCEYLLNNSEHVEYCWLSMSRGWRGYNSFKGWNIKQEGTVKIGRIDFDRNESRGKGGGFLVL